MEPQKFKILPNPRASLPKNTDVYDPPCSKNTHHLKVDSPSLNQHAVNLSILESRKINQEQDFKAFSIDQRPPALKTEIDNTFQFLKRTKASFRFFGEAHNYDIGGLNAYSHIQSLLKAIPKDQSEFVIVDLGAGLGGFGEGLLDYMEVAEKPQGLKIHMLSLTGEDLPSFEHSRNGATHYYFGQFKAECFQESLCKLDVNFEIKGQIDFLVSDYTLLHFHDPIGTLADIYSCLRPERGMILSQGFPTVVYKNGQAVQDPMETVLHLTGAPLLLCPSDTGYNEFLMKRQDTQPLALPLQYLSLERFKPAFGAEKHIATFVANSALTIPILKDVIPYGNSKSFYGDKQLFLWLANNNEYLKQTPMHWEPLLNTSLDETLDIVPKNNIFYAIQQKDSLGLKTMLEAGESVNQRNYDGVPILFIAIRMGLFKIIEPYAPDLRIRDPEGKTGLMMAVAFNDRQCLEYCATQEMINAQDKLGNTALHHYILTRRPNLEVLQYLIDKGADATIPNARGDLPLHYVAQKSIPEPITNCLIEASKAVLNRQNGDGETPLHLAYAYHQQTMQRLLIDAGASREIRNKQGLFAEDASS